MGAAKARGTKEQRIAQAIERKRMEQEKKDRHAQMLKDFRRHRWVPRFNKLHTDHKNILNKFFYAEIRSGFCRTAWLANRREERKNTAIGSYSTTYKQAMLTTILSSVINSSLPVRW